MTTTHQRLRRRIFVAGYYGFANAGDEAILQAMLRDLRTLRSSLDFVVLSGNPDETRATHDVESVLFTDVPALAAAVAGCDLLLLGGGGIFHDHFGFDPDTVLSPSHGGLALFSGIPLLAALLEKPLMIFGAGVGPLHTAAARDFTRFAFGQSRVATVRDSGSQAELSAAGVDPGWVRVVPDAAFGLGLSSDEETRHMLTRLLPGGEDPLLGVALRNWDVGVDPESWEREVVRALDAFLDAHAGRIVFVPLQELTGVLVDDRAVAERLQKRMRHAARTVLVPGGWSPGTKATLLGRCRVVLGMRLHSLIFALRSGVPVVAIIYDRKVRSLVEDAGITDLAVEIGSLRSDAIVARLERALRDRDALSPGLAAAAAEQARAAKDHARLALDVLDGRVPAREDRDDAIRMFKRAILALSDGVSRYHGEVLRWATQSTAQAAQHASGVAHLREEIGGLRDQLSARDEGISWLRDELRARDAGTDSLRQQICALDQGINALRAETRARDEGIDWLRDQIRVRDEGISWLRDQVQARDDQIHARDESISELQSETRAGEARIDGLATDVRARDDRVDGFEQEIGERDASIEELREEIDTIHQSRTWRWAATGERSRGLTARQFGRRQGDAARRYRVTLYCPDRHVMYDGRTPDREGIGGGVTARLRLAAALARRGHSVEVVCHCRKRAVRNGVLFRPLDTVTTINADILVMHTTGGALDLRPVLSLGLQVSERIVLVDGVEAPKGLQDVGMDRLYACSNFIASIARDRWGVARDTIVVSHHGVIRSYFRPRRWRAAGRNPFAIAYATHPSKGLGAAIEVLRRLRREDDRFELHVFGGSRLWGQQDSPVDAGPGVIAHGLLGQRNLARQLAGVGFALYLQERAEPFGIAVAEALAAGCITIASAVGAHEEIIDDGVTGFLLDGAPASEAVIGRAANIIQKMSGGLMLAEPMRRRAQASPLDWDTVAAAWEQSWQREHATAPSNAIRCVHCSGRRMLWADGYHCTACGYYSRTVVPLSRPQP